MIHVIIPHAKEENPRLEEVLAYALEGRDWERIEDPKDLQKVMKEEAAPSLLFAVSLPRSGDAPAWRTFIADCLTYPRTLEGAVGAVIVDGAGELFTKSLARELIFAANYAGCAFPGKPLVEARGDLYNFNTAAKIRGVDNFEAYLEVARALVTKLEQGIPAAAGEGRRNVLMIHASSRATSNSLLLWEMVKKGLGDRAEVTEISIRDGAIVDCRGCGFETCRHFGEKGDCFYGGLVVEQVYPAILACDALVLICPNYNDAVGASLTAMFNRLTALFYNNDFSAKKIFALVVSGYSGGELLAEQVIGAMCLNKGFALPPHFAMLETANDPRSILERDGVEDRAAAMAARLLR